MEQYAPLTVWIITEQLDGKLLIACRPQAHCYGGFKSDSESQRLGREGVRPLISLVLLLCRKRRLLATTPRSGPWPVSVPSVGGCYHRSSRQGYGGAPTCPPGGLPNGNTRVFLPHAVNCLTNIKEAQSHSSRSKYLPTPWVTSLVYVFLVHITIKQN